MLVVPEILGHRQRRVAHAEPAARRFVHLPEHHHHVRQHARRLHVTVKLLAFPAPLAYPAKDPHALLGPFMLGIMSVSNPVLPTPAPPNRPALPPRSSGTRTSMTLIPVSKISDLVERRANGGGARWTVRHWTSAGAAWRSMALPKTSNIRERMPLPTGAFNWPPVSSTELPRARPSVGVSAIPRTRCASS